MKRNTKRDRLDAMRQHDYKSHPVPTTFPKSETDDPHSETEISGQKADADVFLVRRWTS